MSPILNCEKCASRLDSVFCDLSSGDLVELNRCKTTNIYKKGQILFNEGDPADGLYCITSGRIKLIKNGENGKEIILRILAPGQIIGLRGVLSEKAYAASAQALEQSTVCFIDQHFFKCLIKNNTDTAFKVIQKLSEELTCTERQISDLTNKDVRIRLSQLILALMKTYGRKTPMGILLDIPLTRTDMASMISSTPETVIRLLSDFQSHRHLQLDGKKIYISNPNQFIENECPAEY